MVKVEYELGKSLEVVNAKLDWIIRALGGGEEEKPEEKVEKPKEGIKEGVVRK